MLKIATREDLPYLNYIFSLEENRDNLYGMLSFSYQLKMASYLSELGYTLIILSDNSVVVIENIGEEVINLHLVLGIEDRGSKGLKLMKELRSWYKSLYPNTRLVEAYIPENNKKCKVFASLSGLKNKDNKYVLEV